MAGIPIDRIPQTARTAWLELRNRLLDLLTTELVAMWGHGGTTSAAGNAHRGDLDTHVILSRRPGAGTIRKIEDAHAAIAATHGVEWDAWYVLLGDARRPDRPRHAWQEGRRDTSWALHRAHWRGNRYVLLHGAEPSSIVPAPTWPELLDELDRELEHIERHVVEGDTDAFEATYAFLNGSRILRSLASHDVAASKHTAGSWALEHLPHRWHDALRAAMRTYGGHGTSSDAALLAAEMASFVSFVREQLPPVDRPRNAVPRWSGY